MRFEFMNLAKGDLLFVAESACMVSACVAYGLSFGLLVHPMILLERSSATTSRWQRLGDLQFLPLTKGLVRHAASWFSKHDGTIVALGHSVAMVKKKVQPLCSLAGHPLHVSYMFVSG